MSKSTCSIPDCDKRVVGWGYCPMHYRRFKLYGDPHVVQVIRGDDEARFWSKIKKEDCWDWQGRRDKDGYAIFSVGGKNVRGHRWAYEFLVGAIPEGLMIDHLCRNTGCVNPDHMEPVDNRENQRRGTGVIARNILTTQCPKGHLYDDKNTSVRNGRRICRACERERNKRHREMTRNAIDGTRTEAD